MSWEIIEVGENGEKAYASLFRGREQVGSELLGLPSNSTDSARYPPLGFQK